MSGILSDNTARSSGLAKAASFGPGTFADMYTPKWNPRVSTLRELEDFMLRYDIRVSRGKK